MGVVLQGPWSSHPFRGRSVVMFTRSARGGEDWVWGKLHLATGDDALPLCGVRVRRPRQTGAWRSQTANPSGWNPGAYSGDFPPCKRCLRRVDD